MQQQQVILSLHQACTIVCHRHFLRNSKFGTKLCELRPDKNIELRWNGYNESGQDIEPSLGLLLLTRHSYLLFITPQTQKQKHIIIN